MSKALKINQSPTKVNLPEIVRTRDYNPFWQSDLFHEVFLRNDVPEIYNKIWNSGETGKFGDFCNSFRNLCSKYEDSEFESWSERTTIRNWIVPILEALGFQEDDLKKKDLFLEDESFTYDNKTLRPDFVITSRSSDLQYIQKKEGFEKLQEAREYVKVVVEAKYWGRLEDIWNNEHEDKRRADKKTKDEIEGVDPADQVMRYLKMLNNEWGIVTDGKLWRLYHKDLSSSSKKCFQFNLGYLFYLGKKPLDLSPIEQQTFDENIKYFFHIFSKDSLISASEDLSIVNSCLEFSRSYAEKIEPDLRERFKEAMTIACDGYHEEMNFPSSTEKLDSIRDLAESHIFNSMFIIFCESKGVLQMKGDYREKSLTRLIRSLEKFKPERGFDDHNLEVLRRNFRGFSNNENFRLNWNGTELYDHLLSITDLIQKGSNPNFKNFKIEGFKETVFSKLELELASKYKLKNQTMVHILFKIGYLEPASAGNVPKQIAYNIITPRQLGSIYEGFLEHRIMVAKEDLIFQKGKWTPANLTSQKVKKLNAKNVKKGKIYFDPSKKDRKDSGSYYTPDSVVQFMVSDTLERLLKNKRAADILKIRICDPAIGSGHFINAALNFISAKYISALENETFDDITITHQEVKQQVLHNCIFGIDINPRAVKLAKMGLWLESARAGKQLENLDLNILCGDSLIDDPKLTSYAFNWKKEFSNVFKEGGFDVIIGNPPYIGEAGHKGLFEPFKQSKLGKIYYQGKMDMWYAFGCLAIDVVKQGGLISLIAPNTWIGSAGASKFRTHLLSNCTILKYIDFADYRVFEEAAIQTMIYIAKKETPSESYEMLYTKINKKHLEEESLVLAMESDKEIAIPEYESQLIKLNIEKEVLSNPISFSNKKDQNITEKILKIANYRLKSDEVSTGIDVHQDFVTEGHLKLDPSKNYKKGDGIFILSQIEKNLLGLSESEKEIVKPYFTSTQLQRYFGDKKNSHWIIYTNKANRDQINKFPHIKKHLEKFKSIITSDFGPYGLHRAREQHFFEGSKIVSLRKVWQPTFTITEFPSYVSQSYFVIKPLDYSVNYLAGILNSNVIYYWLYHRGKKQGEQLQIDKEPLLEIPIVISKDKKYISDIEKNVVFIIESLKSGKFENVKKYEEKINLTIYEIYQLNQKEINIIEEFIGKRNKNKSTAHNLKSKKGRAA